MSPPSTSWVVPVMQSPAGLARNATTTASSPGSPWRPAGTRAIDPIAVGELIGHLRREAAQGQNGGVNEEK